MSTPRLPPFVVVLALAFALCLSSAGCGAFDEIDKASALLNVGKPGEKEKAEAAKKDTKPRGLDWTNVTSLNTGEVDAKITRCTIGGSTTFTHKDDCLAQGGTPGSF
jgi:hypothetical protein